MLYLIATPIGNLEDITFRAVKTLKMCDLILCEDTRVSQHLLKHYAITSPLKSYHQFNEASQVDPMIEMLKIGKTIGLISDAGTPLISDPGFRLVKRCREENMPVVSIPGACSAITALSGSGLPAERFQFIGFLPKKQKQLTEVLIDAILYEGTTAAFESPHRLVQTLSVICQLKKGVKIAVCRELTKKFEETLTGSAQDILAHYKTNAPKGEIVLLIQGEGQKEIWKNFPPAQLVQHFQEAFNLSTKEAVKLAAEHTGLPKKELYRSTLEN